MASNENYLKYVLEQFDSPDVTYRKMMSEYVLYYKGKVVGGIYDDRLLLKPTASAKEILPDAPLDIPYDGAKAMILIENIEDKDLLNALINAIYEDLPAPKPKKKR